MITLSPVDPDAAKYELTEQEERFGRRLAVSVNTALLAWPLTLLLSHLTPCHVEALARLAVCR
jgi:hypothetical protein